MLGLKAKLIGLAVVAVVIGVLVWQVKYWHGRYVVAVTALAVSEQNHASTTAAFGSYRLNAEKQLVRVQKSLNHMGAKYKAARKEANGLSRMLARHDFGHLAKVKPGLIAKRVNAATERVRRELESRTTDFSRGGPGAPD